MQSSTQPKMAPRFWCSPQFKFCLVIIKINKKFITYRYSDKNFRKSQCYWGNLALLPALISFCRSSCQPSSCASFLQPESASDLRKTLRTLPLDLKLKLLPPRPGMNLVSRLPPPSGSVRLIISRGTLEPTMSTRLANGCTVSEVPMTTSRSHCRKSFSMSE